MSSGQLGGGDEEALVVFLPGNRSHQPGRSGWTRTASSGAEAACVSRLLTALLPGKVQQGDTELPV